MYNLNNLMRPVLITAPEVVFHAPTKHTLDVRTIEQSIIVAEERLIRPVLGYDFYEALVAQKNVDIISDNISSIQTLAGSDPIFQAGDIANAFERLSVANQKLWKMHLWKLVAECVVMLATPEGFVQFSSEGIVHTNPTAGPLTSGNTITPGLQSVKWAMDKKMMDRIDPLTEAMHQWICRNKADYPLYERECDCDAKGIAYKRKTDMILGIYDDDENDCSC
jgi:hypothetical protein